jgi:hypothetical protein
MKCQHKWEYDHWRTTPSGTRSSANYRKCLVCGTSQYKQWNYDVVRQRYNTCWRATCYSSTRNW